MKDSQKLAAMATKEAVDMANMEGMEAPKFEDEGMAVVDFSEYPEVGKFVSEKAAETFRSPDNFILWCVAQEMKRTAPKPKPAKKGGK